MGKTADKLNYLLGTKEAIRDAIENKGVEVSDSDTFRSYADKIEAIETGEPINNQEKSISITSNGTRTVTPDEGYTGLSLVQITTNVATEGGDSQEPEYPVIGDGKTYLHIRVDESDLSKKRYLRFAQTAGTVQVDWGDGSSPLTLTQSSLAIQDKEKTYDNAGDYIITLEPSSDCVISLGYSASNDLSTGILSKMRTSSSLPYKIGGQVSAASLLFCEIGINVQKLLYSFHECYNLQSVVIPEGVTSIGDYTFNNCYNLQSVVIPEGVTSIGDYTFNNCYNLQSIVIPEGVTSIGENAFGSNSRLQSVVVPKSVTSIGNYAFDGCHSLQSIVIPEGVTSIGKYAFYNCYCLQSIVIPEGVTSIGNHAFDGCRSLQSIVIPEGVTSIGENAFDECASVLLYDFSNCTSVPTLANNQTFYAIPNETVIVVLDLLYDEWINATYWNVVKSQIVKASEYYGYEPIECLELSISANDVIGNKTSTKVRYVAITNGYYSDGRYVEGVALTGKFDESFPQNTSSEDILREVSFTFMGITATTTFIQGRYMDLRVICKYNVTSALSNTSLLYSLFSNTSIFDSMFVDGEEVTFAKSYKFATTGEHEVIFKVNDEADITSVYQMFRATSLLEVDFCETDLSKVTSTSTSSGTAYLFYGCTNLRSVVFPDSLKYMGYYMFYNCKLMASLTIPLVEAPSIYGNYTFGGSSASYSMGYTNRAAGTNILRIPAGATGYDTGAWTARVLSTSYCGFTIEEY